MYAVAWACLPIAAPEVELLQPTSTHGPQLCPCMAARFSTAVQISSVIACSGVIGHLLPTWLQITHDMVPSSGTCPRRSQEIYALQVCKTMGPISS